jgi:hypothetical protein
MVDSTLSESIKKKVYALIPNCKSGCLEMIATWAGIPFQGYVFFAPKLMHFTTQTLMLPVPGLSNTPSNSITKNVK